MHLIGNPPALLKRHYNNVSLTIEDFACQMYYVNSPRPETDAQTYTENNN